MPEAQFLTMICISFVKHRGNLESRLKVSVAWVARVDRRTPVSGGREVPSKQ